MKARVLVLAVNDGEAYVVAEAVRSAVPGFADEAPVMAEWEELALIGAHRAWSDGGQVRSHGFVDIEIPDAVIAQVLRRHADAGVVEAVAVGEGAS